VALERDELNLLQQRVSMRIREDLLLDAVTTIAAAIGQSECRHPIGQPVNNRFGVALFF
jgi:hypothetical protein